MTHRYRSRSPTDRLVLSPNGDTIDSNPLFQSFCDSDWAMSKRCKSISRYIILCSSGPIAWSSKQQGIVTLSTCEAEYVSCMHWAHQIISLRSLFKELGFPQTKASDLYCDNLSTVSCTHDPHSHSRMTHIDIHAHFIRDCICASTMALSMFTTFLVSKTLQIYSLNHLIGLFMTNGSLVTKRNNQGEPSMFPWSQGTTPNWGRGL